MQINRRRYVPAIVAGSLFISLIIGASAAQAATVLANGSQAYRIENLEVTSGMSLVGIFNVDFLVTSAEAIYGSPNPNFDFPTQDSAEAGRDAILAALNDYNDEQIILENRVVTVGPKSGIFKPNFFKIGFAWDEKELTNIETVDGIYRDPSWVSAGVDPIVVIDGTLLYAKFTPVPVPAAVWLFGSALLGLISLRRKQM